MTTLGWIVTGGLLMSAIAMVGGLAAVLGPALLERLLLPFVALAAGCLLGGAFFHMIPEGMQALAPLDAAAWLVGGFTAFLAIEQFVHWHHSHRPAQRSRQPVTYLILTGDAVHNFVGGLGVASTFLIDPRAGIMAWIAAAAHEVPQELGDFGVLVHGGWPPRRAVFWNVVSALTFPIGAVIAYALSQNVDVAPLMLFGAGNFIYIAASDLIPEIKARTPTAADVVHFVFLLLGLLLMYGLARWAGV